MTNPGSLKKLFARQIFRWTLLGFLGSAGIALMLATYMGVESTESHLAVTADAAVKAFRQQILGGEARESELQIQDAFHLSPRESVVIRDSNFKRVYQLGATSKTDAETPSCSVPLKTCWYLGHYQVSTLAPIYFDSDQKQLYGYLELNLTPKFDFSLILGLFIAICAGSLIQGIGMCTRFVGLAGQVGQQLRTWADHIRENPQSPLESKEPPLEELRSMHDALAGLNHEITRLEEEARDSAKLSIIRGISHDILSPVSQLQKLLAAWNLRAKREGDSDAELLERIHRILRRLAAIAQQTKLLRPVDQDPLAGQFEMDITRETSLLLTDLQKDSEIEDKRIELVQKATDATVLANVAPEEYLRIVDNLVRNAVQASEPNSKIEVKTVSENHAPVLLVKDQGSGIPKTIQSKIFDLNFTTRPGTGTGLGLAIVKQLCERNRAKISFFSAPGFGTEFRIEFQPAASLSEVPL